MIEIINQQSRYPVEERKFKDLLNKLILRYKLKKPEITLAFVTNKVIRELNKKYLDKDSPTDVLSFPLGEKGADGKLYFGDIIISMPTAYKQSRSKKHSFERELEVLTIHGFLHLLGYEHYKGLEEEEISARADILEE
jgi:probable rRNA maturation factor